MDNLALFSFQFVVAYERRKTPGRRTFQTNIKGSDEISQQYGAGGQIKSSYYPHPQQQVPRNFDIQLSAGSTIDRSCMIF